MNKKSRLDPRAPLVRCFALLVVFGLLAAIAYDAAMSQRSLAWPSTSFLYAEGDRFTDWYDSIIQALSRDPYHNDNTPALAAYFPGAYLVFSLVGRWAGEYSLEVYLIGSALLLLISVLSAFRMHESASAWKSGTAGRELNLLTLLALLCAYPVLFSIDRGNVDVDVGCACVLLVTTSANRCWWVGVCALAFSISAKGYPAAFILLLLVERRYKRAIACLMLSGCISLVALLAMDVSVASSIDGLRANLSLFYERYVLGPESLFGSSDPYNALRLALSGYTTPPGIVPSAGEIDRLARVSSWLLRIYTPLVGMFAAASAVFVVMVPSAPWQRVTSVCLVAVLFPNVVTDYKLCCLLPGILVLLASSRLSRREVTAGVLFGLLFIPKSYYLVHERPVSMFINPILLMALASVVMWDKSAWAGIRLLPVSRTGP